jgi:glycosyltransferase involved in cell wall biosynthesis
MLPLASPVADLASLGIPTFSLGMRLGVPDPGGWPGWPGSSGACPDVVHAQVAQLEATRRGAAPAGSILLVPNGLSTAPYAREDAARDRTRDSLDFGDGFTWLAVGRLAEAKGYGDMVAAFAPVLREHGDARLLIAGVGALEHEIRAETRRLGIEASVRLLGLRSDVPALMQAADGFVMTSGGRASRWFFWRRGLALFWSLRRTLAAAETPSWTRSRATSRRSRSRLQQRGRWAG